MVIFVPGVSRGPPPIGVRDANVVLAEKVQNFEGHRMPSEAHYGGTGEPEIVDESRTAKGTLARSDTRVDDLNGERARL